MPGGEHAGENAIRNRKRLGPRWKKKLVLTKRRNKAVLAYKVSAEKRQITRFVLIASLRFNVLSFV